MGSGSGVGRNNSKAGLIQSGAALGVTGIGAKVLTFLVKAGCNFTFRTGSLLNQSTDANPLLGLGRAMAAVKKLELCSQHISIFIVGRHEGKAEVIEVGFDGSGLNLPSLYLTQRKEALSTVDRSSVVIAAITGAAAGSTVRVGPCSKVALRQWRDKATSRGFQCCADVRSQGGGVPGLLNTVNRIAREATASQIIVATKEPLIRGP